MWGLPFPPSDLPDHLDKMLKFIQLRDANLICGSFTDKNDTNNNMQKIQLLKDNEQKEGQDKNPTMLATSMVTIIHQGLRACESPSILINDGQTPIFIVTTVLVKPALVKLLITYSCNHCGIKVKIHIREGLNILLEDHLLEQTPFSKRSNLFG